MTVNIPSGHPGMIELLGDDKETSPTLSDRPGGVCGECEN